jgi:hypothetical protein
MELKFELTTEPAIKVTIANEAFANITGIISNSPNAFDIDGCIFITALALIIGTYKIPAL